MAIPVIGFLGPTENWPTPDEKTAFYRGLAEAGYVEGHNVEIEYRWAAGLVKHGGSTSRRG